MNIIYSDRDLAVIIKPVGMDSEHQVPAAIVEKLGGEVFPIHRLDLNVGGVMVYARTKFAAAQLSKLVQEGQLVKEYRALVHGTPPEGGLLEDFLFKDSRKNKVFVVKKERKGVKKASLEYTRLTDADPSLVHINMRHTFLRQSQRKRIRNNKLRVCSYANSSIILINTTGTCCTNHRYIWTLG
jgi:23S rRNA pseudouridine1911/1915/1917 synthase